MQMDWLSPEARKAGFWLLKNVNRAIREFDMLAGVQRVAVALSGGKDSLSLLSLLAMRNLTLKIPVPLLAIHILGDANAAAQPLHAPLCDWLEAHQVDYRIAALEINPGEALPLDCQRCTHHRRRKLFEVARANGCDVVALGHHADDLAETTLMNLLAYGRLETMPPRRDYFNGATRVIRPLCYTKESEIRRFTRLMGFPPPPPLCPRSDHTRRAFAKEWVRSAEQGAPGAKMNLLRAGLRATPLPGRVEQDDRAKH